MRLPVRHRPPSAEAAIIPLINVVFLILIFVMLTAVLDPPIPLRVRLPETGLESRAARGATLAVAADGRLAFDGEVVGLDTLLARLAVARIRRLTLRADADVPLARFLPVAERIEGEGISIVVLAVKR
ncbi:MAG: biopolymer transporter ExbD [Geminicoccaceae bacterium]|nr:biopolymer transporter ExbD [Geminicoccaceae bacterium]